MTMTLLPGHTEFTTHSGSVYFIAVTQTQGLILGQVAPEGEDYHGKPQRILVEHGHMVGSPDVGERFIITGIEPMSGREGYTVNTSPVVEVRR